MKFETADKLRSAINALDEVERRRSENRVRVVETFEGFPPLTEAQAAEQGLRINCDWKEAPLMFADAAGQYYNAFVGPGEFFSVTIKNAPLDKATDWNQFVTDQISTIMTRCERYDSLWDNKAAGIVMHGVGLQMWDDPDCWCPNYVAIEDFRCLTGVDLSFCNMDRFFIRRRYTPGEIAEKIGGENSDPGWNKKALAAIFQNVNDQQFTQAMQNVDWNVPERWIERIKECSGFMTSDAAAEIPMWDCYYQDDKGKWLRRVVADENTPGLEGIKNEFIYTSRNRSVADELNQLIHNLPGDLSNKPPRKYHAIRSLGFTLVEPAFWLNITRCFLVQHTIMTFKPWVRTDDPADRARALFVEIGNSVVLPEGVNIVPWEQRHRIDPQLVQFVMSNLKQLMGEAGNTYTQDIDTGTQKERTAYETSVLVNMVNSSLSRLLLKAYKKESFAYREICRRLCKKGSLDKDAKEFQAACKKHGMPDEMLDVSRWKITPTTTLGQGNKQLAISRANQLMGAKTQFPPESQNEILYLWTCAVVEDPALAAKLTKRGQQQKVTSANHDAALAFGSLMQGVKVDPMGGFSPIEQIETLLQLMQEFVKGTQAVGLPSMREILGLNATGAHIEFLIEQLAQDQREKARVKQYSDALGQIMNQVKKLQQNVQQAEAAKNQSNSMELQAAQAEMQQKLQQRDAEFQQKMQHKQIADATKDQQGKVKFVEKVKQGQAQHEIKLQQQAQSAAIDTAADVAAKTNDLLAQQAKARITKKSGGE